MRRLTTIFVGWLVAGLVWASPTEPVAWTASLAPDPVRPGEVATLVLRGQFDPGWHIYGVTPVEGPTPTGFRLAEESALTAAGSLVEPAPQLKHDEAFDVTVTYHEGAVELRQGLRVPADAAPGELAVQGELRYQPCTDRSCLPPMKYAVDLPLTVEAGAARTAYEAEPEPAVPAVVPPDTTSSPEQIAGESGAPAGDAGTPGVADQARSAGLLSFLLVAYLAGFAALLTPCVFPMIPITVSFFTKQAGDNPSRRVSLAVFYGLGIVLMYTGLGLLLAGVMGATGTQRIASNPWVNLGFAALFIFFAFSLFGYFELALPQGLVNRSSTMGSAGGYIGAAFMGLTLTLAAFTCNVQFVGGILVWAANGEWIWPILGMLSFSLAFASPFVLLALFPQYLASMPKSGGWLHDTKVVLAFVELGAAFKFISNADLSWQWMIFSRELVLAIWAICALGTAIYLFGRLSIAGTPAPLEVSVGKKRLGWFFVALFVWLSWGMSGAKLETNVESLLPPSEYRRGVQQGGGWIEDLDEGLAAASARGTLALLDFTGVTCTNCRWMEQNLFIRPEIARRMSNFALVKLYTDRGERADEYRELQIERFNTVSLPFYVLMEPNGRVVATFDGMTRNEAEFAAFLDQGR